MAWHGNLTSLTRHLHLQFPSPIHIIPLSCVPGIQQMPSYPPLDDTHDEDEDEYDYEDEDEDERMSILDLPSTVLYDIFVLVQVSQFDFGSKHDLRNFAVVHSSWSGPAARVMDRALAIETRHHLRSLAQKLATSSKLANRIARTQYLELDFSTDRQVRWEKAARLVTSMPILRRCRVAAHHSMREGSVQESFYRLFGALGSVNTLRELICTGPNELSPASQLMNAVSRVQNIHTLVLGSLVGTGTAIDWKLYPQWPPIQRLSLRTICFEDDELFPTLISKTFPNLLELELWNLQWPIRDDGFDPTWGLVGSAIKEAAKSQTGLKSLRISLGSYAIRSDPLVEAIAECRHLRSLQLHSVPRSSQGRFISYLQAPIEFLFMGTWDRELVRELEENLRPGGTLRPHLKRLLIVEEVFSWDKKIARRQDLEILSRACAEVDVQLRFCSNFWCAKDIFGGGIWESATARPNTIEA